MASFLLKLGLLFKLRSRHYTHAGVEVAGVPTAVSSVVTSDQATLVIASSAQLAACQSGEVCTHCTH